MMLEGLHITPMNRNTYILFVYDDLIYSRRGYKKHCTNMLTTTTTYFQHPVAASSKNGIRKEM